MNLPTATYRLQLREGVDFDAAIAFLPHLAELGTDHLYLSPIFTAGSGSTHGYDITDPNAIDPALGGAAGFDRLAAAARQAGIGLILDIVPNHTAFSLENPWLRDVLRHGRASPHAANFDIDWDEGPLILPWLGEPFEALLQRGEVTRRENDLVIGDLAVPLDPSAEAADLTALHEAQAWRLVHWVRERDGVTHRRFFNVTGLVGMRVEDPAVFEAMHALVFDLVKAGKVQGLRLDHIDGLADPAAYLARLRQALPDTPIWVEKILTGDERLPDWPVEGTTGYEAATIIARVLGDADGVARLRKAWCAATDGPETFHEALIVAKGDVIRRDLAAELRRLMTLAARAADGIIAVDPGEEALREAFIALLTAFPRYRSYFGGGAARAEDIDLLKDVTEEAAKGVRGREVIDLVAGMLASPRNPAEAALRTRFQQVTGALLAKAHEDTAGFRWTSYLAASEVGADPDRPVAGPDELAQWAAEQPGTGILLTSSHDTKRSEDARMRLVACSHLPQEALALIAGADGIAGAASVPANMRWYLVQSALGIWDADDPGLVARLQEHATKALREADEVTSWTHPVEAAETAALDLVEALVAEWRANPPEAIDRLMERGAALSLSQLALKLTLPGVPDIYRGCEVAHFALTDPDNRRPVDLAALRAADGADGLSGAKSRLTQRLLSHHRDDPQLLHFGATTADLSDDGILRMTRSLDGRTLTLRIALDGRPLSDDPDPDAPHLSVELCGAVQTAGSERVP